MADCAYGMAVRPRGICFPSTIIAAAKKHGRVQVVSDQIGSPTYAADLAEAVVSLLQCRAQGIVHAVNGGHASWHDLASAAVRLSGMDAVVEPISTAQWMAIRPQQARRTRYSVLDTTRLAGILGCGLRPWDEALRAYCMEPERPGAGRGSLVCT